ncbi:LysR family transcriptional regulator [Neorhizobium alkalisoli]|uniref:DNA-binding transcriptional LysR family regulator n=1 Tax=Neorhizobium alkalisoli TaxID=528178 RepID=A0A561QX96_9HYPH|nr:LysR family transcriptional regulator [Neorhizobium alkalisoli]TWF54986.1 DNA-binding transcriptional LysR family regulator [Neorhizobium alkalisoli]
MKFDLTDLRIFLAAVDGGSLTAAAARNNIVVAAVSARLRRLEEGFKLELFERTGRGIKPTLAGDILARHARRLVEEARRVETELDGFADGRRGRVRLLSNTNMLAEHMPKALGTFLAANPEISVSVVDKPSFEVTALLKNGEADIGIVAASADMVGLERWRFVPDKLVVVVGRDFPLSAERMKFSHILDFRMIGMPENVALSQFKRRLARELGREVDVRMRLDGFEGICRMVECNAGIAIIPETAAVRFAKSMELRIVQIDEGWADRELYLCVKSEAQLPGYARKLLHHLNEYAQVFGA